MAGSPERALSIDDPVGLAQRGQIGGKGFGGVIAENYDESEERALIAVTRDRDYPPAIFELLMGGAPVVIEVVVEVVVEVVIEMDIEMVAERVIEKAVEGYGESSERVLNSTP